jgi:hypothetical protein
MKYSLQKKGELWEGVASQYDEHHTLVACCYAQSQGQGKPMTTGPFLYTNQRYTSKPIK